MKPPGILAGERRIIEQARDCHSEVIGGCGAGWGLDGKDPPRAASPSPTVGRHNRHDESHLNAPAMATDSLRWGAPTCVTREEDGDYRNPFGGRHESGRVARRYEVSRKVVAETTR